jgi:putative restriction endonuclease
MLFGLLEKENTRAVITQTVLDRYWPETLHSDLRDRLGLPEAGLGWTRVTRPGRERAFVERVLRNYNHRCAMCGFQAQMGDRHFGLDAAHLRWFTCDGPNDLDNGLSLCKLHHWSLDRGVTSIAPDHTIRISPLFIGRDRRSRDLFHDIDGKPLAKPDVRLGAGYIEWHVENVFRGA